MSLLKPLLLFSFISCSPLISAPIIMLDPAGDAVHKGRTIDGTFERGITLRLAERIKKAIEFQQPLVRVMISRAPGEAIEPLQTAHITNRLKAKLFVHLACFQETGIKPTVSLYYTLWHPITDFWQEPSEYAFIALQDAYKKSLKTTSKIAHHMNDLFAAQNQFQSKGAFGLPLSPLIGIQVSALIIELGLRNQNDWQTFIEPISSALIQAVYS